MGAHPAPSVAAGFRLSLLNALEVALGGGVEPAGPHLMGKTVRACWGKERKTSGGTLSRTNTSSISEEPPGPHPSLHKTRMLLEVRRGETVQSWSSIVKRRLLNPSQKLTLTGMST